MGGRLPEGRTQGQAIYSRGISGDGFCHVAHKGPAKFLGFAMAMKEEGRSQSLSENIDGCSEVHDIPGIEGRLVEASGSPS